MVCVVKTYGHYEVSHADVCPFGERLLNPELLQLYLAAFLLLAFPLCSFIGFVFYGTAGTGVFELYLGTHCPALAEVVTYVDDHMRNVETSVTGVVLVGLWIAITVYVIAIVVAC